MHTLWSIIASFSLRSHSPGLPSGSQWANIGELPPGFFWPPAAVSENMSRKEIKIDSEEITGVAGRPSPTEGSGSGNWRLLLTVSVKFAKNQANEAVVNNSRSRAASSQMVLSPPEECVKRQIPQPLLQIQKDWTPCSLLSTGQPPV